MKSQLKLTSYLVSSYEREMPFILASSDITFIRSAIDNINSVINNAYYDEYDERECNLNYKLIKMWSEMTYKLISL